MSLMRFLPCLLLLALGTAQASTTTGLLDPNAFTTEVGGQCTFELTPDPQKIIARLQTDGDTEDFPFVQRTFAPAQDWRGFARLRLRVRLTPEGSSVRTKNLALVVYDENERWRNLEGQPKRLQMTVRPVACGDWAEFDFSLAGFTRSAVSQLLIYCYEQPAGNPHRVTLEIDRLELMAPGEDEVVFDGSIYKRNALNTKQTTPATLFQTQPTTDGLSLALTPGGAVAAVKLDGQTLTARGTAVSGLLLADAATGGAPVAAGGEVTEQDGALHQSARLEELGLGLEARYVSRGRWLEISGEVADLTGADRAVTVYFALPLEEAGWLWNGRPEQPLDARAADACEQAYLDTNLEYGRDGLQSLYPVTTMNRPDGGQGVTLGVRMDEPVVQRMVWNPGLRRLFIAADFGLTPGRSVKGREMSKAPFRFLLYRHDPRWGMRGAMERYYDFFPGFFTKRIPKEGGWSCWGRLSQAVGGVAGGLGIDWGPYQAEAACWDNRNGVLSLIYIEPSSYQQTMGDMDRTPTEQEALERVERTAAGDMAEMARWENLTYARVGFGVTIEDSIELYKQTHDVHGFMQALCKATMLSVMYDFQGKPFIETARREWIGDSNQVGMIQCNLDPDIPQGKGWFNIHGSLAVSQEYYATNGAVMEGTGLDCVGWSAPKANYRREHFVYCDVPLTFSAVERVPVQGGYASLFEWLRELDAQGRERGHVIMGNCAEGFGAWYTYGALYLDVFGIESSAFQDPWLMRTLARGKTLTHLTYSPAPAWKIDQHLLHGIFPGEGDPPAALEPSAALYRELAAVGWEPVTRARCDNAAIMAERFGDGRSDEPVYLVLYNSRATSASFTVTVESQTLAIQPAVQWTCALASDGTTSQTITGQPGALRIGLPPLGTICLFMPPAGSPMSDYTILRKQIKGLQLPKRDVVYLNEPVQFGKLAGTWSPQTITEDPQAELEWNVSEHVGQPGTYEATLLYVSGTKAAVIDWVALCEDGREIARDTHYGWSGVDKQDITYRLRLEQTKPGARYTLRARMRGKDGHDSAGELRIRLAKDSSNAPD